MLHTLVLLAVMEGAPAPLSTPAIVERLVQADNDRLAALGGYTGVRHYRFENKKYNKRAELTARIACDSAGVKKFEVISESGNGFVRNHILHKMMDAEEEASQKGERQDTRIIPANYDFRLIGMETLDGHDNYVLEVNPKKPNKFLIRGRIWVDAGDFAITRVEGQPAKNPSFWIRSVQVVQRYERNGKFWLPASNQSVAQARVFGTTEVVIEYSEYATSVRDAQGHSVAGEGWGQ